MGDARCGRTAGTAGRVCRPPQTARRQVSGQGGSRGTPRAGRGRTRGWGEGRGREPWGPKRLGPKRPSPARRVEGCLPFPSPTAPGSAAGTLRGAHTHLPGNGTSQRPRTDAEAESAAGSIGVCGVRDPSGMAQSRNQGSGRREGVTSRTEE